MENWTPPKQGSPCWIQIPATDVPRAKKFYSSMFGWTFKPPAGHFTDETVALFNLPDDQFKSLSGGICKFEKEKITQGSGATTIFLYVDDLDDASAKIKEAGGKLVGDQEAEGDTGIMQDFEDTEGNFCGIYSLKKKN